MPQPLVYLQAMAAAALVSALLVAMLRKALPPASSAILAAGLGLACGCLVLPIRIAWPPVNGLDRFLTIIMPATIAVELVASSTRVSQRVGWLLRLGLAGVVARVLLHGSVYLGPSREAWTSWQAALILAGGAALLASVWALLYLLAKRSPGASIPLALALAIQCAGVAIMMAGYVQGGAVSFPLTAAIGCTAIVGSLIADRPAAAAIAGITVVALFSLLVIGRFFGRLTTGAALMILLAPLLGWVAELPMVRYRQPWFIGSLRLFLVAVPLIIVLLAAKRSFDRDLGPLLVGTIEERAVLVRVLHGACDP